MTKPVLVLGATGGFGGAMTRELVRRGRDVRVLARDPARARRRLDGAPVEIVAGDAEDQESLFPAARGCGLVVHGVNLPYSQWESRLVRVTENVIAAARFAGAGVLFPGNVYSFGDKVRAPLTEFATHTPCSRKGTLRMALEESLERSAFTGIPNVVILRAGDYFGPTVRNGLVDRIFGHAAAGRPIQAPGNLEAAHQWAFTPDLARLGCDLIDRLGRLAPFEVVHFKGHVAERQRDFLRLVAAEAGHPQLPIRRVPWAMLRLAGLVDPDIRELMELRYLFDDAVILDDPHRRDLLPGFEQVPVEQAVRETLESYRAAGRLAA